MTSLLCWLSTSQVHEWEPAIELLKLIIEQRPLWWTAYQTLGRAQVGFGLVKQARLSFSRAFHFRPWEAELWREDLGWCQQLYKHVLAEEEAAKTAESS